MLSVLSENWCTKYLKDADSKSRLKFLKFPPQNPFLGKFGLKNLKLSVLSENWCTKSLKDADSKSRLKILKFRPQNPFLGTFGPKNLKLSIFSENWYTWYLKDADSYSKLVYWFSNRNFLFGQIWAKKVKVVHFNWKLVHMVCWKCRFWIRT